MGGIRRFIRAGRTAQFILETDDEMGALAGMIAGAITVIIWANAGLSDFLYEIIPGFAVSLAAVFVVSLLTQAPSKDVTDQFHDYRDTLSQ